VVRAWLVSRLRLFDPTVRAERAYALARERLIRKASRHAVADAPAWMSAGSGGLYGRGLDERVIEYPWVHARLGLGERLLDVGSTLNTRFHTRLVRERFRHVAFLNPYRDDGYRSRAEGVSYVCSDIRSHGLRRGSFDRITCISTLEHVGCDNSRYGGPVVAASREDARRARADAMRTMRELLAPSGRLLLTVPFGCYEHHGWFVQLDAFELEGAVAAFAPRRAGLDCFLHDGGWRRADVADCADARYGALTRGASAVACLELEL
jgi:hypothetical protein